MILPEKYNAMYSAIVWANQQASYKDAWNNCINPNWLIHMYGWKYGYNKDIALAVCDTAEELFPLIRMFEYRPQLAIKAVRKWAIDFDIINYDQKLYSLYANDVIMACRAAFESCSDHGKLSIQRPAVYAISKVCNITQAIRGGHIAMAGLAVDEIAHAPVVMAFKAGKIEMKKSKKEPDFWTDIPEYNEAMYESKKELCNIIRKHLILRD